MTRDELHRRTNDVIHSPFVPIAVRELIGELVRILGDLDARLTALESNDGHGREARKSALPML